MKIEELKKGQPYNVRLLFQEIDCDNDCVFIDPVGLSKIYLSRSNAANRVTPISTPSEPPTSVGPAPKYDPCREFKAGDKVELKTNFGRNPYDTFDGQEYIPDGTVFTVLRDEWAGGKVDIFEKDESDAFTVHYTNLELVTPVEELEPYFIGESENSYDLFRKTSNGNQLRASFWWKHNPTPDMIEFSKANAKAAAEDERDRLNAEYRKEQK